MNNRKNNHNNLYFSFCENFKSRLEPWELMNMYSWTIVSKKTFPENLIDILKQFLKQYWVFMKHKYFFTIINSSSEKVLLRRRLSGIRAEGILILSLIIILLIHSVLNSIFHKHLFTMCFKYEVSTFYKGFSMCSRYIGWLNYCSVLIYRCDWLSQWLFYPNIQMWLAESMIILS